MTEASAPRLSDVFRAELRSVVDPIVRAHGFKGSSPRWTMSNSQGDVVLVQTELSRWNTDEHVSADVYLALVPAGSWKQTMREGGPKRPSEYHGLFRSRLETADGMTRWDCTDAESAVTTARAVGDALPAALVRLVALLDRGVFRAQLPLEGGLGNMGDIFHTPLEAEVIVLSDQPGPELKAASERLLSESSKKRIAQHPTWADWVWELAEATVR